MCYRCSVCDKVVGPKVALLRHVISREVPKGWPHSGTRREIERELPVCRSCKSALGDGVSIPQIQFALRPKVVPQVTSLPSLPAESIL